MMAISYQEFKKRFHSMEPCQQGMTRFLAAYHCKSLLYIIEHYHIPSEAYLKNLTPELKNNKG